MRTIGYDPTEGDSEVQLVASGTLSTGDAVVVNSDGTVSVVAETAVSQGIGSSTVFESADSRYISSTYDANAQKVVIAYRDDTGSGYGTAVVGTVSGTSISFGTPVVFNSASSSYISATYDANAQKVVIAYTDYGGFSYGTAVVGTVSGTSISFGTPVVFESLWTIYHSATYDANAQKVVIAYTDRGGTQYGIAVVGTVSGTSISFGTSVVFSFGATTYISATYDANAQKVVVAFPDANNSYYGTAVVGTVSGTSISFGTPVVFASGSVQFTSATYDANAQKVIIAYSAASAGSYGTAVVGTVSGTSISFGTPVVFENANSSYISATYDANAQKIVVAYRDEGNSYYGTAVVGTVSGTSISFAYQLVWGSVEPLYTSATYDSTTNKVVIAYADSGNSYYGAASVYQNASTSTNLTSSNFIGFAKSGAADTQAAPVQLIGSLNQDQSSLTAGQKYYVQTDGTLSTTPGTPSVLAGTAVSSTQLLVKG